MARSLPLLTAVALCAAIVPIAAPAAFADAATSVSVTPATAVTSGTGNRSAASYAASFELAEAFTAEDVLPLVDVPVDPTVWGPDAGEIAGWIEPADLELDLLSYRRQGPVTLDIIGRRGAGTIAAGDRIDVSVTELVRDYLAPLDAPRGATNGRLAWDATVTTDDLGGAFGGVEEHAFMAAVRADLIALDGDVDARSGAVDSPVLRIDLGRTFPADTPLGAVVVVAAPAAQYIGKIDAVIDRATGSLLVSTSLNGYLPRTIDMENSLGRRLSSWRLPLQIGIIADPDAGEASRAVTAVRSAAGGTVVVVSDDDVWRGSVEPGAGVRLAAGSAPALLGEGSLTQGVLRTVDEAAATAPVDGLDLTGPAPASLETAAWLAASEVVAGGEPVRARFAGGAATVSVDPDRGGVLALEGWLDERGQPLTDSIIPDAIDVNGITHELGAPDELHLFPTTSWISFGSLGTIPDPDGTDARRNNMAQIYTEAALDLEASWLLPDGSRAVFSAVLEGPDSSDRRFPASIVLRRAAGGDPRITLDVSGPLAFDDGTGAVPLEREATRSFDYNVGTLLGTHALVTASIGGEGLLAVQRDDGRPHGTLVTRPRPLKGPSIARVGAAAGTGTGSMALRLDAARPAPSPTPDTVPCGDAEAVDAAGDGTGGLDVVSIRVDDSRDWLTITLDHASLPAAAPLGGRLTEDVILHLDNFPMTTRITLDDAGGLTVNRSSFTVTRSGTTLALHAARERLGLDDGEVIRDVGAITRTVLGTSVVTDRAPDATGAYGTGGTHVIGGCRG